MVDMEQKTPWINKLEDTKLLKEKFLDCEVSNCLEHKLKSKIGNIFVNEKIHEEYCVKIYEIDPYFYGHFKELIKGDKNNRNYMLFKIKKIKKIKKIRKKIKQKNKRTRRRNKKDKTSIHKSTHSIKLKCLK